MKQLSILVLSGICLALFCSGIATLIAGWFIGRAVLITFFILLVLFGLSLAIQWFFFFRPKNQDSNNEN